MHNKTHINTACIHTPISGICMWSHTISVQFVLTSCNKNYWSSFQKLMFTSMFYFQFFVIICEMYNVFLRCRDYFTVLTVF